MRLACPACRYAARPLVEDETESYTCPECGTTGPAEWISRLPRPSSILRQTCLPTLVLGATGTVLFVLPTNALGDSIMAWCAIGAVICAIVLPIAVVSYYSKGPCERAAPAWSGSLILAGLGVNVGVLGVLAMVFAALGRHQFSYSWALRARRWPPRRKRGPIAARA